MQDAGDTEDHLRNFTTDSTGGMGPVQSAVLRLVYNRYARWLSPVRLVYLPTARLPVRMRRFSVHYSSARCI